MSRSLLAIASSYISAVDMADHTGNLQRRSVRVLTAGLDRGEQY